MPDARCQILTRPDLAPAARNECDADTASTVRGSPGDILRVTIAVAAAEEDDEELPSIWVQSETADAFGGCERTYKEVAVTAAAQGDRTWQLVWVRRGALSLGEYKCSEPEAPQALRII